MTVPKHLTSNVIATIGTIIIHILLYGALNFGFKEEQSSHADDDEITLNLEEFIDESITISPLGRDPLSDQNDKSSESMSTENGAIKPQLSPTLPPSLPNIEPENVVESDTIIEKIQVVQAIKVDTITSILIQDSAIAEIIRKTQPTKQKTGISQFKNEREKQLFYQKNYKYIRNFKKVYPYALKTRLLIDDLNNELLSMNNEAEKKKLIKETEQMLFKEYESAVRTMSTSQGRLLLKLIARETNKTGYEIIKDYKGGFSASFWYGVGKIFGADLKSEYHREKEDTLIENIVNKYQKNDLY